VTGRRVEDFETIARRYAALPRNQPTFGNWLREFGQFILAPLSPGFDLNRYDRELRPPVPSSPQSATDSKVWRQEHAIANAMPPERVKLILKHRYEFRISVGVLSQSALRFFLAGSVPKSHHALPNLPRSAK